MADQPITDLPVATALTGAEFTEVVQGGANKKTQEIAGLIPRILGDEFAAVITNDSADIAEGGWPVARDSAYPKLLKRFYAEVMYGAGSCLVHVLVDGFPVHGPITVSAGPAHIDTGLFIAVPAGSAITFDVAEVSNVQGLWLQVDGGS